MATLRHVERVPASGKISLGDGTASVTHTLTTELLDTSKAFLVFGIEGVANSPDRQLIRGKIISTTQVRFDLNNSGGSNTRDVVGYVVEFSDGVTVQRGTIQGDGTSNPLEADLPDQTVDLAKTFVTASMETGGDSYDENVPATVRVEDVAGTKKIRAEFTTPPGTARFFEWEAVTHDACTVQRGSASIASGDTASASVSIAAVASGKAFLNFTQRHGTGTVANIGQKLVRGRFTALDTIVFDRYNTGVAIDDIRWEVVEFTDDTAVEEVLSAFADADGQNDETVTEVSGLDKAIAFASWQAFGGKGDYSADDIPGAAWFNCDLTTTTNLRLTRKFTTGLADVAAYVVDFGATGGATSKTAVSSLEAAVARQRALSAALGAGLSARLTTAGALDAALARPATRPTSLEAALAAARVLSSDLEAALTKAAELQAALDASLTTEGLGLRTAALDAAVLEVLSLAAGLEGALQDVRAVQAAFDGALAAARARSAALDGLAARLGLPATAGLEAALRGTAGRSTGLDAVIGTIVLAGRSRTFVVPPRGGPGAPGGAPTFVVPAGNRRH